MIREATRIDLSAPLDINSASRDELNDLPGVGPAMVDRIIAARPFSSLDDMQRVDGFGPVVLERINPFIIISDPMVAVEKPSKESGQGKFDQTESQVDDEKLVQVSGLESQDVIISSDEEGKSMSIDLIPEQELDSEETENDEEEELILDNKDPIADQAEAEDFDRDWNCGRYHILRSPGSSVLCCTCSGE